MKMDLKGVKLEVKEPEDIFNIMMTIFAREKRLDKTREHLWTISLDCVSTILNIEHLSTGSHRMVSVDPVDVFSIPLQKKASKLIIVHNHPSGKVIPSKEDIDTTNRLIQIGSIMKLEVIEHTFRTKPIKKYFLRKI